MSTSTITPNLRIVLSVYAQRIDCQPIQFINTNVGPITNPYYTKIGSIAYQQNHAVCYAGSLFRHYFGGEITTNTVRVQTLN